METAISLAAYEETINNQRSLVDDTPGHGAPVYVFASNKRSQAFLRLMGEWCQTGLMDRAGELTLIAALVTRDATRPIPRRLR